jgi:hypothetical protein
LRKIATVIINTNFSTQATNTSDAAMTIKEDIAPLDKMVTSDLAHAKSAN